MEMKPEVISLDDWETKYKEDKHPSIFVPGKEFVFTPFQIGDVIHDTDAWVGRSFSGEYWSPRSYALHLFWWILGCVAIDSDVDSKVVTKDYVRRAIRRLKKGGDSGLLPADAIRVWETFSEPEKQSIQSLLSSSAEGMESFPTLSKMNIIATHEHVSVRFGNYDLDFYVPVIVETKSGIAGVTPILSPHDVGVSDVLTQQNISHNIALDSVHIWDLYRNKRAKAFGSELMKAEKIVSSLRFENK